MPGFYLSRSMIVCVLLMFSSPQYVIKLTDQTIIKIHEYIQLGCQADVDWTNCFKTTSSLACSRMCADNTTCSLVHYKSFGSLCKLDERPPGDIVKYTGTPGPVWSSYLKEQSFCDAGWMMFGSSCYFTSTEIIQWTACETYCSNHGAYLATIRSNEEMDFARGVLHILPQNDTYLHIGGKNVNGSWTWTNGEPWDYEGWHPLEPSGGDEICLGFFHLTALTAWSRYDWNDLLCYANGYCLCEKSKNQNRQYLIPSCQPVS